MSTRTIIEVSKTHGLIITLCSNSETICDGREVGAWEKETTQAAISDARVAMEKILSAAWGCDECSYFREWHGGRYYGRSLGWGNCYISAVEREITVEDDEEVEGEWEWVADAEVPAEVKTIAERLADAANAAIEARLEKSEQDYAETEKANDAE